MTNQNNSLVFVYGSLRRYESNHLLLRDATPVSLQARTRGILLDTGFGYPAAAEGVEWIYGELYRVNPVQLQQLDMLEGYYGEGYYGEGYINHYDRVQQTVFTDNGAHEAWIYRYSNEQAEGLEPVPFGIGSCIAAVSIQRLTISHMGP